MRVLTERRRKRQAGNILVEFALSFFLMFWIFSGLFQFGYAFYAYDQLVSAVRDGARYAANHPYTSTTTTPDTTFSTHVKNMVVYGSPSPAAGAPPVAKGLTTANVRIVVTDGGTGSISAPSAITVSVQSFNLDAVFATFKMDGRPAATF